MTDIDLFVAKEMLLREHKGTVCKDKNEILLKATRSVKGNFFGRRKQETSLPGRVTSVKKRATRSKIAGRMLKETN